MGIKIIPMDPQLHEMATEVMRKSREQVYTPETLCALQKVIEAQYYYWWCMDMKKEEWAGADLFTDDFSYYCFGPQTVTGPEQAQRSKTVNAPMATSHMGHQPLVWLMSDTEARGIFQYEDYNLYTEDKELVRGWAVYIDDFVKGADGKWRMKNLRLMYTKMEGRYKM